MAVSDIRLHGNWQALCMVRSNHEAWASGYGPAHGYYQEEPDNPQEEADLAYPWQYLGQASARKMVMTSTETGVLLKTDGTVWVTGENQDFSFGNTLGLGSRNDTWNAAGTAYTWVRIPGLSGIVDIEAGEWAVFALKDDGRLYGWGDGRGYEFNSSGTNANIPTQVHGLDDVADFSLGSGPCAVVREGGTLWTWGQDVNGSLGQGVASLAFVDHPVQVDSGVDRVEIGLFHTLYRKSNGSMWGMGPGGSIGAGDNSDYSTPVSITGPGNVTNFSCGEGWSIAINAATGRIWTVGANGSLQLARASLEGAHADTWGLLEGEGGAPVVAVDVHAAPINGVYVTEDCAVFAWGQNAGQIGDYRYWVFEQGVPQQILKNLEFGHDEWDGNIIDYAQTMQVFEYDSVVLTDTGKIYQWGGNLSDDDYNNVDESGYARPRPTLIATVPGAVKIGTIPGVIYLLKDDGTVWRMGYVPDPDWEAIAELDFSSLGTTRVATEFEQVPGLTDMVDISTNGDFHVAVQDSDGVVWGIGFGRFGALGMNAIRPDEDQPWKTYAPDGVEIDASGAVASMSGGKMQTDIWGIFCAYEPIGIHHTGAFNTGARLHESSHFTLIPDLYWPGASGFVNVWIHDSSNAFPQVTDDYGIGYSHGVYIIGGECYVAGGNSTGMQGNGTTQSSAGLLGEAYWYDDDLSGSAMEPFAEPSAVCFKDTSNPISDFVEVLAVGQSGTLVRRASGEVWGWGTSPGFLGDPTLPYEATGGVGLFSSNGGWPIHVPFWDDFESIYMTWGGGLAQDNDGQLWGWGDALQAGQGFDEGIGFYSPPVPVWPGEPIITGDNYLFACDDPAGEGGDDGGGGVPTEGQPPDTTPNPPRPPVDGPMVPVPPPAGGGCRASMDGPSSCNYNVPIDPDFEEPDFPLPGDFPVFPEEFPEFPEPEMPTFDVEFPQFPNFCGPPDFGQLGACKPAPGTNHMPGGRDRKGRRGTTVGWIKVGGPTYGKDDQTFNQDFPPDPDTGELPEDPDTGEPVVPPQRCWPADSSIMTAITTILLDLGVSPLQIVWEIGPEYDKSFGPHCFPESTGMMDAARWLAAKLMLRIIDEGEPSFKVFIGPPTHRPQSQVFTYQDQYYPGISTDPPFSGIAHGYSGSEAYFAVKVWGSHLSQPAWAIVDTPFSRQDPTNILEIQVGPNHTFAEAQEVAYFRAALIRRAAVSVQVTVPYNENHFMRDTLILQVPSAAYQETFSIFGKQSEVTVEAKAHILTGVLPATLAELDQFPDLLEDPEPVGVAFLDWPDMRAETKRKGEARMNGQMARRQRRKALYW